MLPIVGSVVVIASVLAGFVLSGGKVLALWQPFELLVIGGAAFGGFLTSNSPKVVKQVFASLISVLKGPRYKQQNYLDILSLMYELLNKICQGEATRRDLEKLEELCEVVGATSLCGLGQTAPNPVLSTLRYFRHEYLAHIDEKRCPAGVCDLSSAAADVPRGEVHA